jgi:hypothetical protein
MKPEQQLRYLQIEWDKARAENTRLRKALAENGRHARRIEKAYEDALLLATLYSAGIIPSRRYARLQNMKQNRWQNAVALLKLARIITRQRHWVTADLAPIETKLTLARQKALKDCQLFFCGSTVTADSKEIHYRA